MNSDDDQNDQVQIIEESRRYLLHQFDCDPTSETDWIFIRRQDFLARGNQVEADEADAGVVEAEMDDDDGLSLPPRTALRLQLNELRQYFWQMPIDQLQARLAGLQSCKLADISMAAARLQRVAEHRESLLRLPTDPGIHRSFSQSFLEIVIAPIGEAQVLKDQLHRWMRAEQNPHYEEARRHIQWSVHNLHEQFSNVFALEQQWLQELKEFDPVEETLGQGMRIFCGACILVLLLITVVGCVLALKWIF